MPWYVIQTFTGKEEKLVEMVRRIVPGDLFQDCFVVYHEQLRSRKQENQIHIERVFPGYAFIVSNDPENLFLHLKKVPAMSKMMATGEFFFTPLEAAETEFLEKILDEDRVIRLSYVATDGKDRITWLSGPLKACGERILEYHFRKRYASVRLQLSGEEKEVRMGILLDNDIRREAAGVKAAAPGEYEAEKREEGFIIAETFFPGEIVAVISGAFEGMDAVIRQVKKHALKIEVRLFGRDITAEVPIECVRKTT